jgi:hypothetical protein
MVKTRTLRVILFSSVVVAVLFGGVFVGDSFARPLWDSYVVLTISGSPIDFARVGEVITYSYEVENTGNYPLFDIEVQDDQVDVECPNTIVAINGRMICTGTYPIIQADIERGSLTINARVEGTFRVETASGSCCGGTTFEYYDVSAEDSYTLGGPDYSVSLTMTGNPTTFFWADEEITYSYVIENTGDGLLEGPFTIEDDRVEVTCPDGGLEPGDIMQCTGSYVTTIEDVEAMAIHNTAVANADRDVTATDYFEVLLEHSPSLLLDVSTSSTTYSLYWQLIVYDLSVTNVGNVAIDSPFHVHDPMLDEWSCPESITLGLGESLTCLGYYRVRLPLGPTITNCATVEGVFGTDSVISPEACTQIVYLEPAIPVTAPTPTPTLPPW